MITIVDYGMGNLASVFNAVKRYTDHVEISSEPKRINNAKKLILPGVGAFGDAYCEIEKRGLRESIAEFIGSGRPFLGICLGLQLLFTRSYEGGERKGFDIIKGDVVPFKAVAGLKIPHMGWNQLVHSLPRAQSRGSQLAPSAVEGFTACPEHNRGVDRCQLLQDMPERTPMYFVHSYYVVPEDKSIIAATTDYGVDFCSMIQKDNIYAVQFHPEKSQAQGLKIIENFVRL